MTMLAPLATIDELSSAGGSELADALATRRLVDAVPSPGTPLLRALAHRLSGFPSDLAGHFGRGGASVGLNGRIDAPASSPLRLVLCDGASTRLRFHDGELIAVDPNFIIGAALVAFFATRPAPYAPAVAASLLALRVPFRNHELPFQNELVALATLLDGKIMRTILTEVCDLVALHEIGHVYVDRHGAGFVRMEVVSPSDAKMCLAHAEQTGHVLQVFEPGARLTSRWDVLRDQKSGRATLILPGTDRHEIDEYAPDVFALLARSVLDCRGPLRPDWLPILTLRFLVWSLTMLVQEATELEAEGGRSWRDTRRILRRQAGARQRPTHPAASTRSDVVLFHIGELIGELDSDRLVELWGSLAGTHDKVWSDEIDMGIALLEHWLEGSPDTEQLAPWSEVFDAHVGKRLGDVGARVKCLAIRTLGELRGLGALASRTAMPHAEVLVAERQIGDRITESVTTDAELAPLREAASAFAAIPKLRGGAHGTEG